MNFQILGVLRVEADGRPVVLRGAMPRAVLAMLLLDANRPVSAERLAIGLWGDDAPPSSVATVQVHVSRLRKALGQPSRVETRREGYVLHIAADELDLARFDATVEGGRVALAAGESQRASDLFTRAMALCSGPPLADLRALPFAAAASAELDERRLAALELRIEADLAIGRHDELVPELQRLVSDHPLRERLHAHLMLALYRAGRQADALAQYRALHRLLSRELGLAPSPALRELQRAILEQDAALSRNGLANVTLPTPLSALIGRTRELNELRALVAERRLVTLVGAGGSGKTRLALEVARELAPSFPDGVFWCSLAAVGDPDLVLPEIGAAIGADATPDEHIADTGPLLLVDNLEHLLAGAPALARLLQRCPNLHLLATSRAPLRIDGEHEYEVEPLPDDDAVALFAERAVVAEPKDAVREICRRLDNLPLAVELAAARTRILPPAQLVERLERRLALLTSGHRDAPERQRTLRATIEWSHDLLTPVEQEQFARAAVFAGSFDLRAAEIVAGITTDGLEALVEWSLVRQRDGRFSMLETIREYATERLELSAAPTGLRVRHASYFLDLAERAATELDTHGGEAWMTRLETEDANLRRALARLIETHATGDALRLCVALATPWALKSRVEEGLRWFDAALSLAAAAAAPPWPAALRASGYLLVLADRVDEAIEHLQIGAELCRTRRDNAELAATLRVLGTALGAALLIAESRAALEEAFEIYTAIGDRRGQSRTLHTLGDTVRDAGNLPEAAKLLERSIALGRGGSSRIYVANATHSLADLELDRGNLDRAEELYRETLRAAVEFGIERHKLYSLAGLAAVAALRGNDARARLLWRGVEGAERELHTRIVSDERRRYERIVGRVDDADQVGSGLAHTVVVALRDLA
jgi:predicted ATPase/DNA-binding SARP family transcriptional activator